MRTLVTGTQMKEIDAYAIREVGIPSLVLMERAALSVADALEAEWKRGEASLKEQRIVAFCGTGNNGADGAAIIRILYLRGCRFSRVVTVGRKEARTEELETQLQICRNLGIPVDDFVCGREIPCDIAVDALFGVGLSRTVGGDFAAAITEMGRQQPKLTVAVDIPSGVSSETGAVLGCAVCADLTVTFGLEKLGCVLYPGKKQCGRVRIAEIGFPRYDGYSGRRYMVCEPEDREKIPKRQPDSHKGTYGKVLVIAGSAGMCGAAYFSALAAYRMGCGLVKILTVKANVPILQTLLPEALLSAYDPETCEEEPENLKTLVEAECAWASVIVLGPGLGKAAYVRKLVEYVLLSAYVPIILDADGLNAVADYPYLADYFTENVIVTPHLGEMSRLTGWDIGKLRENLPEAAVSYEEEKGVTCVLKDAVTVTARKDGLVVLGNSGSSALAKGGSGDVLTGVIAGLVALGLSEDDAASLGVWIHGLAGRLAGKERGEYSVLARETADALLREESFGEKLM